MKDSDKKKLARKLRSPAQPFRKRSATKGANSKKFLEGSLVFAQDKSPHFQLLSY